ncbi:hypothetical protein LOTGIDRAFT_175651 [Lottia gigantea]|uniref:Uncharacterized protein n=1 Tax=Lottia gigantea TaxID=225164 RepID=V4AC78_LOTGI|nr:hypothetical protein LOTGIDRAFT_175651 [Lottia gigantea]ESO92710.1 hypothetical protein LOTGIDRAFT_175651 [Lottia gigantea]
MSTKRRELLRICAVNKKSENEFCVFNVRKAVLITKKLCLLNVEVLQKIWVDMNEMVFTENIYLVVKIAAYRSTSCCLYSVNLTLSVTAKVIETIDIKIDVTKRLVVIF